jgi:hypothetical protein
MYRLTCFTCLLVSEQIHAAQCELVQFKSSFVHALEFIASMPDVNQVIFYISHNTIDSVERC